MIINIEMTEEFIGVIRKVVREEVAIALSCIHENNTQPLMTISNVSDFMQVSISTVRQFMHQGLPHFQEGQVIRFLKSDVIEWTKSNPINNQKTANGR